MGRYPARSLTHSLTGPMPCLPGWVSSLPSNTYRHQLPSYLPAFNAASVQDKSIERQVVSLILPGPLCCHCLPGWLVSSQHAASLTASAAPQLAPSCPLGLPEIMQKLVYRLTMATNILKNKSTQYAKFSNFSTQPYDSCPLWVLSMYDV